MTPLERLIIVLGPTATGKSSLGICLAHEFNGEILVCDSTQVYRGFDIGTAKVRPAERKGIPHHLIDIVEPSQPFTAGDYRRHALAVLEDLRARNKLPIVTAGTGLYLRALLEGLSDAPTRSEGLRERLRRKAAQSGAVYLHRLLARLDPAAARCIASRDTQKIIRAIEMRLLAGKPLDEIHRRGRLRLEGYDIFKIGLLPPREKLYARIDARVLEMMNAGWLDEVRGLLRADFPASAKAFEFIGYSQLRSHLEGSFSFDAAIRSIQQSTRRFAKRQITWFRKEPGVHWLSGFGDDPAIVRAAMDLLQSN